MEIHKTKKRKEAAEAVTGQYTSLRPGMAFPEQHRTLRFIEDDGHTTLIILDKEDVENLLKQLRRIVDDLPCDVKGGDTQ